MVPRCKPAPPPHGTPPYHSGRVPTRNTGPYIYIIARDLWKSQERAEARLSGAPPGEPLARLDLSNRARRWPSILDGLFEGTMQCRPVEPFTVTHLLAMSDKPSERPAHAGVKSRV